MVVGHWLAASADMAEYCWDDQAGDADVEKA
jgi:hypothetical protein